MLDDSGLSPISPMSLHFQVENMSGTQGEYQSFVLHIEQMPKALCHHSNSSSDFVGWLIRFF